MRHSLSLVALAALLLTVPGVPGVPAAPASATDYDGTPHLVRDATPGGLGTSFVNSTARLGERLVYAYQGTQGAEPWITDGSSAGTRILRDLGPGAEDSAPADLTSYRGKVYFSAAGTGPSDRELWVTDGTPAGTTRVKDIRPGASGSYPSNLVVAGGWLYFSADDGVVGEELWRTQGTAATTQRVADLNPGGSGSGISELTAWGDRVVFRAGKASTGNEPWVSDGTPGGTHPVGNIATGASNSNPFGFTAFEVSGQPRFVFTATDDTHGYEMWISDGTTSGLVRDINLGAGQSASPRAYTRYGNRLLFTARTGALGTELWATDGTSGGTVLVKDIDPAPDASGIDTEELVLFRNRIYFRGGTASGGKELWVSEGTAATTHVVRDIVPGDTGSYPGSFRVAGDRLYFSAQTPATGEELWQTDGTAGGTRLVADLRPGPENSYVEPLATVANTLFLETQESHGEELWATTLTASVTAGHSRKATRRADRRRRVVVTVTVRASGTVPTGRIVLTRGSRVIGSGTLSAGRATIRITKRLGVGKHRVRAAYAGSVRARPSQSAPFVIRIR
ncbi:ELWxxDGT repeat protein [Pimelobacter simplex]|uniref:ELWxxDGT repeat protein n=1 Tax=Nocardioides simplex TaxID=2045 RepID=UPI00366DAB17